MQFFEQTSLIGPETLQRSPWNLNQTLFQFISILREDLNLAGNHWHFHHVDSDKKLSGQHVLRQQNGNILQAQCLLINILLSNHFDKRKIVQMFKYSFDLLHFWLTLNLCILWHEGFKVFPGSKLCVYNCINNED